MAVAEETKELSNPVEVSLLGVQALLLDADEVAIRCAAVIAGVADVLGGIAMNAEEGSLQPFHH